MKPFALSWILTAAALAVLAGCSIIPENGQTRFYGLVIGISDYINLDLDRDLQFCDDDANAVYSALLSHGWDSGELSPLLLDWTATKDTIISEIASIVNNATAKDYILIYYSGHGSTVPDQDGDEADGYDEVIVPADYNPASGGPLILDDELRDLMKFCRTEKGLIIFDSCNSGGVINKSLERTICIKSLGARDTGGSGTNGDLDILNFPVLAAAGQNEFSYEVPVLGHGLFTYFILDGLDHFRADTNRDGNVSIRELFEYAEIHTKSYAEFQNLSQHPQIRFSRDFIDILVTR